MADVYAQPAARLDQQPGALLPVRHGARDGHGVRAAHASGHGVRVRHHRAGAQAAADRPALGLGWLLAGNRRHSHGGGDHGCRQGVGALHVLPADDRQPVLLPRRRARGRRLVDLGGADGHQPARLEEGQPRRRGAAGDVRQRRRRLPLGLDLGRRGGRDPGPHPAGGAGLHGHHQRRPGARVLLVDAARHRLLLADADLHRLLHHRAARHRRAPLQRHDGTRRIRAVPRVLDADRHPPPVRRPAGRRRLQVRARGDDGDGVGADAAHGVHHRRLGRDRRRGCAAARACSAGSRRCRGTTR